MNSLLLYTYLKRIFSDYNHISITLLITETGKYSFMRLRHLLSHVNSLIYRSY